MDRRSFVLGAAGALGAATVSGALAGCASPSPGGATGPSGQGAGPLPTFRAYEEVKPDIAPANEYCLPGHYRYPSPALTGVPEKPGRGETVTAWARTSISVAPPMEQNGWWQNLNRGLGLTFGLQWVKSAEYVAKVQTLVAGGDLPDVMLVPSIPRLDQVLQSKFADLSEYLGGDGVLDYPMLANFPTAAWRTTVFGNALYGVPQPAVPINLRVEARTDTLKQLGVAAEFTNGEEFLEFCRAVTDRAANRFAMVQPHAEFLKVMHALPNVWERTDQGFRHEIESERFPDYLDFVAGMWREGLFHPDSFLQPDLVTMFVQPNFLLYEVGGAGWSKAMPIYRPGAPTLTVEPVIAPRVEGGGNAPVRIGQAASGFLSLNKNLSLDRIALVLRMLNWTGAAFGTSEQLAVQFGELDNTYTLDAEGQPASTKNFSKQIFPITTFPGSAQVMYAAGFPDVVDNECAYERTVSAAVTLNAAAGLYSDTAVSKQATLDRDVQSTIADVIQGRRPVSSWPEVVKTWADKGGDQMRREYEALQ